MQKCSVTFNCFTEDLNCKGFDVYLDAKKINAELKFYEKQFVCKTTCEAGVHTLCLRQKRRYRSRYWVLLMLLDFITLYFSDGNEDISYCQWSGEIKIDEHDNIFSCSLTGKEGGKWFFEVKGPNIISESMNRLASKKDFKRYMTYYYYAPFIITYLPLGALFGGLFLRGLSLSDWALIIISIALISIYLFSLIYVVIKLKQKFIDIMSQIKAKQG